jgi:glycosyltransferase involved in cell wall biosynthesis
MNVTVGVTNFNRERFLRRAVTSALEAGAKVIVTDDASTDGSVESISDLPVTIVKNEVNIGQPASISHQLELLEDGWFLPLDSDDFLFPHTFSAYEEWANGSDWYISDLFCVNPKEEVIEYWDYSLWPTEYREVLAWVAERRTSPLQVKSIISVDWLKSEEEGWHVFPNTDFGSDCLTSLEWASHSPKIQRVPLPLYCYRLHDDQWAMNPTQTGYKSKMHIRKDFETDLSDYLRGRL